MEGVVLVSWPGPRLPLLSGGEGGPARLYLVEPGGGTPPITGCLEDWVRLPAAEEEINARAEALLQRLRNHRRSLPTLDDAGVLRCDDRWVDLPPMEVNLIRALLGGFAKPVATAALLNAGWGTGQSGTGPLRVHILRMRRRIAPLGLVIHTLPGRGYMLTWA